MVVSTEDSEIASIVEKYGTSVVKRPVELATDETLLDTVIYGAMLQKEKQAFDEYDIVITIQPSSPLLKTETLDKAIEKFADFNIDSVISVVDDKKFKMGDLMMKIGGIFHFILKDCIGIYFLKLLKKLVVY